MMLKIAKDISYDQAVDLHHSNLPTATEASRMHGSSQDPYFTSPGNGRA